MGDKKGSSIAGGVKRTRCGKGISGARKTPGEIICFSSRLGLGGRERGKKGKDRKESIITEENAGEKRPVVLEDLSQLSHEGNRGKELQKEGPRKKKTKEDHHLI